MKRIFYTIGLVTIVALVMTACNNKPATIDATKAVSHADTVGLAEFQEWKAHNERVAAIEAYQKSVAAATPAVARTTAPRKRTYSSNQSGSMSSGTENQAKVAEKKGWSKAAKGAAIGAGSGAVLGAVINKKNRAIGAVIGGVIWRCRLWYWPFKR